MEKLQKFFDSSAPKTFEPKKAAAAAEEKATPEDSTSSGAGGRAQRLLDAHVEKQGTRRQRAAAARQRERQEQELRLELFDLHEQRMEEMTARPATNERPSSSARVEAQRAEAQPVGFGHRGLQTRRHREGVEERQHRVPLVLVEVTV